MFVNKSAKGKISSNSVLVNIVQEINASRIREESLNGVDYVVIPSQTMPDDVILNRGLYSKEQIERTIKTIDGSPSPVDHPMIGNDYVSAYDPQAALEYGLGVNRYVEKKGNIHLVEKWFNKELLQSTDRGRRLQDAINKGDPIHSSTGVILEKIEQSGENQYGEYDWVANISYFDHDAVLPDSVGAGTPEATGTGVYVNSKNEESNFEVMTVNLSDIEFDASVNFDAEDKPGWFEGLVDAVVNKLSGDKPKPTKEGKSMSLIKEQLKALSVNFDDGASEGDLLGLLITTVTTNAAKAQPEQLTAEKVADIFDQRIEANEKKKADEAKSTLVEKVIAANEDLTEANKDELMATPEAVLNRMIPKPKAQRLGTAAPFVNSSEVSDHDFDINKLMEG